MVEPTNRMEQLMHAVGLLSDSTASVLNGVNVTDAVS
jgi:hypothetical protein